MDLITALCLVEKGWSTDEERTEYLEAKRLIALHARAHYLELATRNLEAERKGERISLPEPNKAED